MSRGIFGGLFDFNGDGKMSAFESAAELQFLHDVVLAALAVRAASSPGF